MNIVIIFVIVPSYALCHGKLTLESRLSKVKHKDKENSLRLLYLLRFTVMMPVMQITKRNNSIFVLGMITELPIQLILRYMLFGFISYNPFSFSPSTAHRTSPPQQHK